MPFATTSLAARIDRAEHEMVKTMAELAARRRPDAFIMPIGGSAAIFAGPDAPWNKIVGLGFGAPLDEGELTAIEALFAARGATVRVELATLADPAIAKTLTRRGYELAGFENVLGLALPRPADGRPAPGIDVALAAPGESAAWIDAVIEGFAHPDTFDGPPPTESFPVGVLREIYQDVVGADGTRLYLARRNGAIAGGGSLRLVDGVAMLTGSATLPAHRRRGVQSALLNERLAAAAADGCDLAVVTTEPASKSQENVQRAGFELLYARAVLELRPR